MQPDSFEHGARISEIPVAPGDFYTVPHECMVCGAPAAAAPDLIAHHRIEGHCYFTKQPSTERELLQAINAANASCVANVRYRGTDPRILAAISYDSCDHAPVQITYPVRAVRQWSRGFFERLYHRK